MKKIVSFFTLLLLVFSMSSCSTNHAELQTTDEIVTTVEQTTAAPTTVESTTIPEPEEYTAEKLSEKTVPEIIEIMGGDFSFDRSKGVIRYSDGGFYIYNDNKLPGFVFYIDEAQTDYQRLKESEGEDKANTIIRENLKTGKYQTISFIAMYESAKLNESISADMDYNQFQSVYGYAPTGAIPPSERVGHILRYDCDKINTIQVYYNYSGTKRNSSEKEDDNEMKTVNPKIYAIVALPQELAVPDYREPADAINTGSTSWKSLYIDYLKSDVANQYAQASLVNLNSDTIPELIMRSDNMLGGTEVCWINQDAVESNHLGKIGKTRYSDVDGLLSLESKYGGIQSKQISSFDGHSISLIHYGEIAPDGTYRWDKTEITKDEYDTNNIPYNDMKEVVFASKEEIMNSLID